jgi:hypothetical protein
MSFYLLTSADLTSSREICFTNRQEVNHPTLMRLCLDFNLRVLQLQPQVNSCSQMDAPSAALQFVVLGSEDSHPYIALTPTCTSLDELEEHVTRHQIDILHDYLFSADSVAAAE